MAAAIILSPIRPCQFATGICVAIIVDDFSLGSSITIFPRKQAMAKSSQSEYKHIKLR